MPNVSERLYKMQNTDIFLFLYVYKVNLKLKKPD